jgi:hypothetical protein
MFEWIHDLPLWSAKVGAVVLFLLILSATWVIPRKDIYSGAPDRARWRDLRIWATLLILAQFVLYSIF